ncbi:SDR family oxidoreductase [Comamonadaceae bacterium G21597-S1]|nr:SDR family oxidoreductase [Comamonadaceae bacterium G21597-S1]
MNNPTLPDWMSLHQQVAVVTGGGTHLGLAMATGLAELGATVYLLGRREDVVRDSAAELAAQGLVAHAVTADAADETAMEQVVQDIVRRHGRLDVMVCNAGGAHGVDMAPHISVADFETTLRLNVTTTLVSAQSAARAMTARRSGAIITVGSLHAMLGSDPRLYAPGYKRSTQSYHAAKGAVLNLTRALACELAQHDITVNCISPGQIPKPTLNAFTRENFRNMVPLGRLGEPRDLKGAVALFASPAGRWITGQNLTVDGGWTAW